MVEELKNDVQESIKDANKDISNGAKEPSDDKTKTETEDFEKKVDDAVDYSDINEMVDDIAQPEEDDTKFREALSELVFKMPTAPISKPATQQQKKLAQEDDDYDSAENAKQTNSDKSSISSLESVKKPQKENICSNNNNKVTEILFIFKFIILFNLYYLLQSRNVLIHRSLKCCLLNMKIAM